MFKKKTDIEELSSAMAWGREKKALSLINKIDNFTVQDDKYKYTILINELEKLYDMEIGNVYVLDLLSSDDKQKRIIEAMINKMTDFSQQTKKGNNALFVAISNRQTYLAEKILEKMTDVSQQNEKGDTALMRAIKKCQNTLALKIIEKMDDFSQEDCKNKTAIMLAEELGQDEIVNAIKLKQGDYGTTLFHLIKQGKKGEAKKLFEEKYVGTNDNKTIAPAPKLEPKSK